MTTHRDPSAAPRSERHPLNYDDAVAARRGGFLAEARKILLSLLREDPQNASYWRLLASVDEESADRQTYLDTLTRWHDQARGVLQKLEPIRLKAKCLARGNERERGYAKAEEARFRYLRRAIFRRLASGDYSSHLRLLLADPTSDELIGFFARLPVEAISRIPSPLIIKSLQTLSDATNDNQLVDVFLPLVSNFSHMPGVLETIANRAYRSGRVAESLAVYMGLFETKQPLGDSTYSRIVEATTRIGDVAKRDQVLSRWESEAPESTKLLVCKFIEAARAEALGEVVQIGEALRDRDDLTAQESLVVSNQLLALNEEVLALDVLVSVEARGRATAGVLSRISQIAAQLGRVGLSEAANDKELLATHLAGAFWSVAPKRSIEEQFDANDILTGIYGALCASQNVEALVGVAVLVSTVQKRIAKSRSGKNREARALHNRGAANWEADLPVVERADRILRALAVTGLQSADDPTDLLYCLLKSQIILREGADKILTSYLVRYFVRRPSLRPASLAEILEAALMVGDDESAIEQARKTMPQSASVDVAHMIRSVEDASGICAGETVQYPIHVADEFGVRRLILDLSTRSEWSAEVKGASIINGAYLMAPDGRIYDAFGNYDAIVESPPVLLHASRTAFLVRKAGERVNYDEEALFVPGLPIHYMNYFHFLGQMLPRIASAHNMFGKQGLKVCVPEYTPKFALDLLSLIGIPEEAVNRIPADQIATFCNLRVVNPTWPDWLTRASDIKLLRERLAVPVTDAGMVGKKIYLARRVQSVVSRSRSLQNELQLRDIFVGKGYEVVDPAEMSVEQQRTLFGDCSVIAGATGAALTNMVFLPPGGKVLCLSPRQTCRTYYPALAMAAGLEFTWILGDIDQRSVMSTKFPHLPFSVSAEAVRHVA